MNLIIINKSAKVIFAISSLVLSMSIYAQVNEFKIGMFGGHNIRKQSVSGHDVPFQFPIISGENTSVLNVLAEDGFNIVNTYHPNEWTSKEYLKRYLRLVQNNGLEVELGTLHFFRPDMDLNGNTINVNSGVNIFDACNTSYGNWDTPYSQNGFRPNFNEIISEIYNSPLYKDVIWGYHISEEASYFHEYAKDPLCIGNVLDNTEVPVQNVSDAKLHYKLTTPEEHKLVIMEANHHKLIHANTNDGEGVYNPQDYLALIDKNEPRDVFFEGSYTQFPDQWYSQNYNAMFNSNSFHYLGAFKSIDYAKNFTSQVHDIIDITGTSTNENYLKHYHSNLSIPNANWLWFQTYNSIIHGAEGIWFWDLTYAWNSEEVLDTEEPPNPNNFQTQTNNTNRFDRSYFPENYRNYISNLSRELRYLVDENLVSTLDESVLLSKTDHIDENCIVPPIETYVASIYQYFDFYSENYGLRYTIRTNGDEVIMIISNPLNIPVSATLDFSKVSNQKISTATAVEVLFELNSNVNSSSYKVNRNSGIDLTTGTIDNSFQLPINQNHELTLAFGPLDVHIVKFIAPTPAPVNTSEWIKSWTNNGKGNIGSWNINETDRFIVGNFDGNGNDDEEILCVRNSGTEFSLIDYQNGNWISIWSSNTSTGISPYISNLQAGDFNGDGQDELLGNDPNGYITMFNYDNGNWIWQWSDYNNKPITAYKDKLVVGDFDGDGKDEILGCDLPNGWTTMFHFENNEFQWGWSDGGQSHPMRVYRNKLEPGDFDGDGKDEILGFDNWTTLFDFDNNQWNWTWSNNGSGGIAGSTYPSASGDFLLIGDIDSQEALDELFFIKNNDATTIERNTLTKKGWYKNWFTNTSTGNSLINDWELSDWNGGAPNYFLVKAESWAPKQLFCLRGYGCDGDSQFLASMYKSASGTNKNLTDTQLITSTIEEVKVYPNPTSGDFTIDMDNFDHFGMVLIELYSIEGKLVFSKNAESHSNEYKIPNPNLKQGQYLIKVSTNNSTYQGKVVFM